MGGERRKRAQEKFPIVTASSTIIPNSFGVLPRTPREVNLFHHPQVRVTIQGTAIAAIPASGALTAQ